MKAPPDRQAPPLIEASDGVAHHRLVQRPKETVTLKDGKMFQNGREVELKDIFGVKPDSQGKIGCAMHLNSGRDLVFRDGQCVPHDGVYYVTSTVGKRKFLYHEDIVDRVLNIESSQPRTR